MLARSWLRAAGRSANMMFRVRDCLKREHCISHLNLGVLFLKSITSLMKLILKIKTPFT